MCVLVMNVSMIQSKRIAGDDKIFTHSLLSSLFSIDVARDCISGAVPFDVYGQT